MLLNQFFSQNLYFNPVWTNSHWFLSSPKSHWFILMVPVCCTLNPNSVVQKLALQSLSPSFLPLLHSPAFLFPPCSPLSPSLQWYLPFILYKSTNPGSIISHPQRTLELGTWPQSLRTRMRWSQVTGPQCICYENKYSPLQTCVTWCYRRLSSCRVSGRSFSSHEESTIWLGESVAKTRVGWVIEKEGKTKTPKSRIIMLYNPSTKGPGHYQIINCYWEAQSPAWLQVWSWERHVGMFRSLFPSYFMRIWNQMVSFQRKACKSANPFGLCPIF